ncbi:MAG: helix-turn-helix transcriptional regulator [Bacillota bacterium]
MRKADSSRKDWAVNQASGCQPFIVPAFTFTGSTTFIARYRTYPNTPSLAASLEVARRSIERDLEYLRDMLGAPLVYDHHRRGCYYADKFSLPPLTLSQGEVVAIFLAHKLLAQVAGTALEDPVCSAFAKIQQWLPESVTINE